MEQRILGRSDLSVSALGFGCWAMGIHGWPGVTDEDSIRAVHRALDLGFNLFDTADVYGLGHSEQVLARALGSRASEVVVATKGGVRWDDSGRTSKDISPAALRTALKESLRRLGVGTIPLYQVHWPDGRTPLEEAAGELQRCREEGHIRWFGFCNISREEIEGLLPFEGFVSTQTGLSPLDLSSARPVLSACEREGIGVLAYSPLAQGMFSGGFRASAALAPDDVRRRSPHYQPQVIAANAELAAQFEAVALELEVTPSQLAIGWALAQPGVTAVLSGVRTAEQVAENVPAATVTLSTDVMARLNGFVAARAAGD